MFFVRKLSRSKWKEKKLKNILNNFLNALINFRFFGGGGRKSRRENKGPELMIKIRISLEDIYNGKEITIFLTKQTICPHCRGSGADNPDDVKTCPECNGTGYTIKKQQIAPGFYQQFQGA